MQRYCDGGYRSAGYKASAPAGRIAVNSRNAAGKAVKQKYSTKTERGARKHKHYMRKQKRLRDKVKADHRKHYTSGKSEHKSAAFFSAALKNNAGKASETCSGNTGYAGYQHYICKKLQENQLRTLNSGKSERQNGEILPV